LTTSASDVLDAEGGGAFAGVGTGAPIGEIAARSPWQLFWRRLKTDKLAMGALIVVILLILIAAFAPLIIKAFGAPAYDHFDAAARDQYGQPTGPSSKHIWGIDAHGGDVFSRTIYGARTSLTVAIVATGMSLFIGIVVGLFAGFYRGWVDTLLSRTMDVLLAFPILLLALGIASACSDPKKGCLGGHLKPGIGLVIAVIAFANWPYVARLVRGQVLSLREREFVEASRSLGASGPRIMFREILPNLVAPIIVYGSLVIPQNILFEAALSFLGAGVQFPTASWGEMLADATPIFYNAWWFMLFPGLALLITVLAFNLLGDGLQDALNPRSGR
jgi:ABC-type dipeptide/oligopeptide/nickel transport system permease subunit